MISQPAPVIPCPARRPPRDKRRRPAPQHRAWLMLTCAGLIALAVGAAVLAIWDARREALARYQQTETNLGFVLAEQTAPARSRASIWCCRRVRTQVLASGVTTPAQFAAALGNQATVRTLRDRLTQSAAGRRDQRGRCRRAGGGLFQLRCRRQPVDVSDREFFGWFRDHQADVPFISPPVQGRLTEGWTAYVVRRVAGPDGQTLGFVAGALALSYFEEFYRAIAHDDATAITLMRRGGTILVRYPDFDQYVGTRMPARIALVQRGGTRAAGCIGPVAT